MQGTVIAGKHVVPGTDAIPWRYGILEKFFPSYASVLRSSGENFDAGASGGSVHKAGE